MADYTTIANAAAITNGGVIETAHLTDNFNGIISAFADRLDKTDPDPQSITGKITFAGGVGGSSTAFDGGLLVSLLSFFAQGIKFGASLTTDDGDFGYNAAIGNFEGRTAGSKKTIVTPRVGMASLLAPIWQSATVVRIPAGYWQATASGAIIDVASNLDVNLASTGALGRETGTPTESSDTWYYLWLCRGTSGVTGVWSISRTSITAPTGYTDATTLIQAAFRNDASSNLIPVKYIGAGKWKYLVNNYVGGGGAYPTEVVNPSSFPAFTAVSLSSFVPPISTVCEIGIRNEGGADTVCFRPTGSTVTDGVVNVSLNTGYQGYAHNVPLNGSQSVDYRVLGTLWRMLVSGYTI